MARKNKTTGVVNGDAAPKEEDPIEDTKVDDATHSAEDPQSAKVVTT